MPPVKRNAVVELTITDLAYGGKGLARLGDYLLFAPDCPVPGRRILAQVTKARTAWAEVKTRSILERSPQEIPAPCPYFAHCGGCRHQNLPYTLQLEYFQRQVRDLYHHLGGFAKVAIEPIIPAVQLWHYRNKMEFAFSNRCWRTPADPADQRPDFALGLRVPGNFYKALDLADCLIAPPATRSILDTVRNFATAQALAPYDAKKHTGFLRHLVIRHSIRSDQYLINIVTNADEPEMLRDLMGPLLAVVPHIVAVVNAVTDNVSGLASGRKINALYGETHIYERLGELTFKISPASFFQTNTLMAERLYQIVEEYVAEGSRRVIWDLYCGTGSIALYLARQAEEVIGFEISPAAVADARENVDLNKINNVRFIEGDLNTLFTDDPQLLAQLPAPDLVILDPPRDGLHPQLLPVLAKVAAERLIYVSCNPATQVRDLKTLIASGYIIRRVQPVDLFPQTPHIEVITLLTR